MITRWSDAFDVRVETDTNFPTLVSIVETELHHHSSVDLSTKQTNVVLRGLLLHLQHQINNIEHDADETHDVYDAAATILQYLDQSR